MHNNHNNSSKVGQKVPDDPDLEEIEELQLAEVFNTDEDVMSPATYVGSTLNVDSGVLRD